MALTLTSSPAAGHNVRGMGPVRLPADLLPTVLAYREAAEKSADLAKQAEAAKKVADTAKARLLAAMDGAPSAVCDGVSARSGERVSATLQRTDVRASEATLTLATGETVPFQDVRLIVLDGNRALNGSDVAKLYGGRSGYDKLTVTL